MLVVIKWILLSMYAACPVAAVGRARWNKMQGRPSGSRGLSSTAGMAVALGTALNFAYATVAGASVRVGQILITCYFLLSLILLLRGFNWAMEQTLNRLFRVHGRNDPGWRFTLRVLGAGITRALILFSIGLPLVMASIMVYRCKVSLRDDPKQQLGFNYQPVSFLSTDGIEISGWWIPAVDRLGRETKDVTDTVIVCHGLGANKSNQLTLGSHFVQAGFNVLIFDFRAHGGSGGQISSFGDLERRDVLGAVRFLQDQRSAQSHRIFGVGASMGAAALIAAAGDDSDLGRSIDAVAVYGTYDSLAALADDIADRRFAYVPPFKWLVMHVAMPMASAHAGADLMAFSPAKLSDQIAPRPIMFIHGKADEVIPFERGLTLRDAASQPKSHFWLDEGHHNDIINSQPMGKIVAEFFRKAQQAI